jgi:septum formation protein
MPVYTHPAPGTPHGPPPIGHPFVYLASASPRRAQLLDQLGVQYQPLLADEQEDAEALEAERSGELPNAYVQRVTLAKLQAARARLRRRRLPEAPILTADTTVALGRRILGKPRDAEQAAEMLQALSGRTHRVLTAVAVSAGPVHHVAVNLSRVRFAPLSASSIQRYIDSGEPFGKAGAYAVQGRMAAYIEHISGSYSGVMGLPLHETAQLLLRARLSLLI